MLTQCGCVCYISVSSDLDSTMTNFSLKTHKSVTFMKADFQEEVLNGTFVRSFAGKIFLWFAFCIKCESRLKSMTCDQTERNFHITFTFA